MNTQKIGVIQALGLGYETVWRSLWVLLIPISLDLFFWLGPRLSIRSLFDSLTALMMRAGATSAEFADSIEEMRRAMSVVGANINLFSLLSTYFMGLHVLPLPTLKAFELPADLEHATVVVASNTIALDSLPVAMLLAIPLLAAGLLIGVTYLNLIGDRVRAGGVLTRLLPQRVLLGWLRLLLFVASVVIVYLFGSIPFLLVLGIASQLSFGLGMIVAVFGLTVSYWLMLYLWFVSYAIVLEDVGMIRAVWQSANVVQRNLLPTFGLILLSYIIQQGMLIIWQVLEAWWLGTLVAVIGNAFIGSGLVAGAFVYYQDRLRDWQSQANNLRVPSRILR